MLPAQMERKSLELLVYFQNVDSETHDAQEIPSEKCHLLSKSAFRLKMGSERYAGYLESTRSLLCGFFIFLARNQLICSY